MSATGTATQKALICSNPKCKIASGGSCLEGFEQIADCPLFGKIGPAAHEVALEEMQPSKARDLGSALVRIDPAETLSISTAQTIVSNRETIVIAIVGPHDAGKTSLIGGVYERFLEGPVGSIAFAGSRSLHAFERACHDTRADSSRESAHTERTKRGEVRFYHLELSVFSPVRSLACLLADRAGEEYSELLNDIDGAKGFAEVRRSDVITILVDGEKISDSGLRHNVKAEVTGIIQAIIEAAVVQSHQRLAVVLTKLDAVKNGPDSGERASRDFSAIVQSISDRFSGRFAEIQSFAVAASPKSHASARGEGIIDLVSYWTKNSIKNYETKVSIESEAGKRSFDRLRARLRTDIQ